ncbi:hypothetical protein E2C01_005763 [Portunus trituberculatus]|uniref:Uncharacterized protein n=1 Tax=Portunus trituberculatus TaxID=210409 RepID=A0A5B7CV80_PORTR|nr:hypothetical protein [Portunus trituberculatus]
MEGQSLTCSIKEPLVRRGFCGRNRTVLGPGGKSWATVPRVAGHRPRKTRSRLDLPEELGPMMSRFSPLTTSRSNHKRLIGPWGTDVNITQDEGNTQRCLIPINCGDFTFILRYKQSDFLITNFHLHHLKDTIREKSVFLKVNAIFPRLGKAMLRRRLHNSTSIQCTAGAMYLHKKFTTSIAVSCWVDLHNLGCYH